MKHPDMRRYNRGVVFEPGVNVDDGYYNLWRGFSVKPVENKAILDKVWYHLKEVMCSNQDFIYQYVLKWLAHSFQHPNTPGYTALVFRGDKGTGKGTLMSKLLLPIWGNQGTHIHNSKHLVGDFNKLLANTCLLFADEAFYAGDKKHESVLKGLITDDAIVIEPKGVDSYLQKSYLKIIMATNSDYAVPASRDERRYCVSDVSNKHKGDTKYFDELHKLFTREDVRSAFLYEMLNLDISGWRPSNDVPETKGLNEQKFNSLDPHKIWLAEALYMRRLSGEVTISDLFADYMCWASDHRISAYHIVGVVILSKYLKNIFKKINRVNKVNAKGFIVGNPEDAIKAFEDYENIHIEDIVG
jgi:hypothetical protein